MLVVGDVMNDIIVRPTQPAEYASDTSSTIMTTPGGSGANQAVWLAHAGGRVRFVGRVGAGDRAYHETLFEAAGVDARLRADPRAPTGTIVVLVDGDGERSMYTDRGANLRLGAEDLDGLTLTDVGLVHLSAYALFDRRTRPPVLELVERARRLDIPMSVDPGSAAYLRQGGPERFLRWVQGTQLIFPNLAEGRVLTGEQAPESVAGHLLSHSEFVVLTCGAQGVYVAGREHGVRHVPADPVAETDTTGAGDAFCGAFLASWVAGDDVVTATRSGVRIASAAVVQPGARPATGHRPGSPWPGGSWHRA